VILKNKALAYAAILLAALVCHVPEVQAECSLNIEDSIISGWRKESVSYAVEKTTLKIKVGETGKDEADSIYIGSIKGCNKLTIRVSRIKGDYPWGGKAIGFSFANDKRDPHQWGNSASFPRPAGLAIEDGFINTGLSNNSEIVYTIDNKVQTTYIGAKVFIGNNNSLELQFSAEDTRREIKTSLPQPSRSSTRATAHSDQPPDDPASCSRNCHEPRRQHDRLAYTHDFSMPRRDYCPDRGD
jgi:hypothetical protein